MSQPFPTEPEVNLEELAVYSALSVCVWVLSVTIFFPFFLALKLSSWLRSKFFSYVTRAFCADLFPVTKQLRKRLFGMIASNCRSRSNTKLKILEIGVGNGPNFDYYPDNFVVTLLDANPNSLNHAKDVLKSHPKVNIERIVLGRAEKMTEIKDGEFDLVLCTHLLCSVYSIDDVLKEVRRTLKTGGKFAFMEHTRFPENHLAYRIQRCIAPLWKVYNDGCDLDRSPQKMIRDWFSSVRMEIIYPSKLSLFFRPHVLGLATK